MDDRIRSPDRREIRALGEAIAEANQVVALTGAGISTPSGIPDFRSDSGVWERHDPADFHYQRFLNNPVGFWEDRRALHETMYGAEEIEPNEAHDAMERMGRDGYLDTIITQNTDGLHMAAGEHTDLIEIHGNAANAVCVSCDRLVEASSILGSSEIGEVPPRCDICNGLLKPDVILFGEQLDPIDLDRARDRASIAEVFLAVGSSLTVEPVASLPRIAVREGATLAVINLDETPVTDIATHVIHDDVTVVLPELAAVVSKR